MSSRKESVPPNPRKSLENVIVGARRSLEMLAGGDLRRSNEIEVSIVGTLNNQIKRLSIDMTNRKSEDVKEGAQNAKEKDVVEFAESHGLTSSEAEVLLAKWGRNELVEKVTPTWLVIFRLVSDLCVASLLLNSFSSSPFRSFQVRCL